MPEFIDVSMPPLPRPACDIEDDINDDGQSNDSGDDKGNRMIHGSLPAVAIRMGPRRKPTSQAKGQPFLALGVPVDTQEKLGF